VQSHSVLPVAKLVTDDAATMATNQEPDDDDNARQARAQGDALAVFLYVGQKKFRSDRLPDTQRGTTAPSRGLDPEQRVLRTHGAICLAPPHIRSCRPDIPAVARLKPPSNRLLGNGGRRPARGRLTLRGRALAARSRREEKRQMIPTRLPGRKHDQGAQASRKQAFTSGTCSE
jgi:hypothetical protein